MTLAHDVHADGPPLLLVHGGMLDRRMWEPNTAALNHGRAGAFDAALLAFWRA